jgi:hypothetical protein
MAPQHTLFHSVICRLQAACTRFATGLAVEDATAVNARHTDRCTWSYAVALIACGGERSTIARAKCEGRKCGGKEREGCERAPSAGLLSRRLRISRLMRSRHQHQFPTQPRSQTHSQLGLFGKADAPSDGTPLACALAGR